jgi:hypothetical protein
MSGEPADFSPRAMARWLASRGRPQAKRQPAGSRPTLGQLQRGYPCGAGCGARNVTITRRWRSLPEATGRYNHRSPSRVFLSECRDQSVSAGEANTVSVALLCCSLFCSPFASSSIPVQRNLRISLIISFPALISDLYWSRHRFEQKCFDRNLWRISPKCPEH